jgi:hypothetical protein
LVGWLKEASLPKEQIGSYSSLDIIIGDFEKVFVVFKFCTGTAFGEPAVLALLFFVFEEDRFFHLG